MSVRSIIQQTLDAALATDKVYSHWMRKAPIKGENPNEYIVYTIDSDAATFRVDNQDLVKTANPVIRYYHAHAMEEPDVSAREKQIETALKAAGLIMTYGPVDFGDIDDVGFNTTGFECSCARLIDGEVEKFLGNKG